MSSVSAVEEVVKIKQKIALEGVSKPLTASVCVHTNTCLHVCVKCWRAAVHTQAVTVRRCVSVPLIAVNAVCIVLLLLFG